MKLVHTCVAALAILCGAWVVLCIVEGFRKRGGSIYDFTHS